MGNAQSTTSTLAAVMQNGLALKDASAKCQNDPAIALAAVSKNGKALQFASAERQDDLTIVVAAINQTSTSLHSSALQYASDELQNDPAVRAALVSGASGPAFGVWAPQGFTAPLVPAAEEVYDGSAGKWRHSGGR